LLRFLLLLGNCRIEGDERLVHGLLDDGSAVGAQLLAVGPLVRVESAVAGGKNFVVSAPGVQRHPGLQAAVDAGLLVHHVAATFGHARFQGFYFLLHVF